MLEDKLVQWRAQTGSSDQSCASFSFPPGISSFLSSSLNGAPLVDLPFGTSPPREHRSSPSPRERSARSGAADFARQWRQNGESQHSTSHTQRMKIYSTEKSRFAQPILYRSGAFIPLSTYYYTVVVRTCTHRSKSAPPPPPLRPPSPSPFPVQSARPNLLLRSLPLPLSDRLSLLR